MSIDRCADCERFLDTDADPEVYREEFPDAKYPSIYDCLCDDCYEERLKERGWEPK